MKLFVAPYSRDCVRMVSQYSNGKIGFVCSMDQVNYLGGYTGFTEKSLVRFLRSIESSSAVHRDHLFRGALRIQHEDQLEHDVRAGFSTIHLHTTDLGVIRELVLRYPSVTWELGTGEDESDMPWHNVLALMPAECIAYLSAANGLKIDGVTNTNKFYNNGLSKHGVPVRVHNCDFISIDILSKLKAAAINVAPQLGCIMTRAYVSYARRMGYDLRNWESEVFNLGAWRKWTNEPEFAVDLGGCYHFKDLPGEFTKNAYDYVCNEVTSFLERFDL